MTLTPTSRSKVYQILYVLENASTPKLFDVANSIGHIM